MKVFFLACVLFGSSLASFVNVDSFDPIVEKVNSLKTSWKAENNFAPHVTISSLKNLMGVKRTDFKLPLKEEVNGLIDLIQIPDEFDARKAWPNCPSISHIRDQGNCGSCWAVAAAGAMTDRICIATNGTFTDPLSEEELVSCCNDCGHGCQGGEPERAWEFYMTHGLVTGGGYQSNIGCQPYSIQACEHHTDGPLPQCSSLGISPSPECQRECTNPTYGNSFQSDHHKSYNAYQIRSDVRQIQRDILLHGPVEADFLVYSDFPVYKSGVYEHVDGDFLGGHAVRIIGWGTENGVDYWLAANSWNTRWGDNGTFKIRRGTNECHIESNMVAGIPAEPLHY